MTLPEPFAPSLAQPLLAPNTQYSKTVSSSPEHSWFDTEHRVEPRVPEQAAPDIRFSVHTITAGSAGDPHLVAAVWEPATHRSPDAPERGVLGTTLHAPLRATVVLLHGVGHAAWFFAPLGHYLANAGYRVIAPVMRGHGSGDLASRWEGVVASATLEQYVADLNRFLDRIEYTWGVPVSRFILAGHSLGGLVSLEVARRRPVGALALIGSPAREQWFPMFLGVTPRFLASPAHGWSAFLASTRLGADRLFHDPTHPTDLRRARLTLFDAQTADEVVASANARLTPESTRLVPPMFRAWVGSLLAFPGRRATQRLLANTRLRAVFGFTQDFFFRPALLLRAARRCQTTAIPGVVGANVPILTPGGHDAPVDPAVSPAFEDAFLRFCDACASAFPTDSATSADATADIYIAPTGSPTGTLYTRKAGAV